MPKIFINEIRGYMSRKDYYCRHCGESYGLNAHIDFLIRDDDLERIKESSYLYCNKCGEKIE